MPRKLAGQNDVKLPNITFPPSGFVTLTSKYHGDFTLSEQKWTKICSAPERRYYPHNGEKVATTLINPDFVKQHKTEDSQFFYYKRFASLDLGNGLVSASIAGVYYAVIIDTNTGRVCTVYPTDKIKPGRSFTPPQP